MNRTAFYYDNRSNLKCVLDPDNGLTYYTYDATRRMTSVKNPFGEVTQYSYSPGGRLTKRILGNGTIAYYSYDAVGQVSKVQNVKSNLTTISSFEYQRNALGSPVSIKREDGSVIYYEYDPKQQLTKETHVDPLGEQVYGWTWDYDLAGNRTRQEFNGIETTYQYDAANELTEETTGGATTYFEYDHCGNTTAQIAPGGTTQYHWDRENLMAQVDLPDGGHNYFAYDADGKRVEKRDSEGYTRFIYQGPDMLKLLQERDEHDDLRAQYTMGNGLESMRRDDASSFYHFDWLGSTFELTDATEAVTDTYLYNAWGEVLAKTGTTGNPHTYVGRERYYCDLEISLLLLGLRYYEGHAHRFMSSDPLRDQSNWYSYVANRPVVSIDPSGMVTSIFGENPVDPLPVPPGGIKSVLVDDRTKESIVVGCNGSPRCDPVRERRYIELTMAAIRRELVKHVPDRCCPRAADGIAHVVATTDCKCRMGRIVAITVCTQDYWLESACVQKCINEHEQTHRFQCRVRGPSEFNRLLRRNKWNLEADAYLREYKCLEGLLAPSTL